MINRRKRKKSGVGFVKFRLSTLAAELMDISD